MAGFLAGLLGSGVASALAAAIAGTLLARRNARLEGEIKRQLDEHLKLFESTRAWKEACIAQLLGPIVMQLERTRRAFQRWTTKNLYLESKVVRDGNIIIRDLLLAKGHLIPPDLAKPAFDLIEHYDRWLEEFEAQRSNDVPSGSVFVFVGPAGVPFPHDAEKAIVTKFRQLQNELYGFDQAL